MWSGEITEVTRKVGTVEEPRPRPSWQYESCPGWCIREHDEDDIVLDRYHQAEPRTVQLELSSHPAEARSETFHRVDAMVRVCLFVGEPEPRVFVEPGDSRTGQMVLTVASALRLVAMIQAVAEETHSDPIAGSDRTAGST